MPAHLIVEQNTSSATSVNISYKMDKQCACLENRKSLVGVTAGGNISHSNLLMKTQWYVLISLSNSSAGRYKTPVRT